MRPKNACSRSRYDNSEDNGWTQLCSAAHRDMYALGLIGDCLYMIGGQMKVRHHYVITDSVERWSLRRGGSWLSFAPLPLPLACHCVVSLKEHLYVLGGWTPQVHTHTCHHTLRTSMWSVQ